MPNRAAVPATIVVAAVLAAACGPAAGPSAGATAGPPSAGATAAASAAPTTLPSPTPAPAVTKAFTFDKGVVVTTAIAGTKDLYVNPGAVLEVGGTLHMFANSFSTWPGHMTIPHLTSSDGTTWTLDPKARALSSDDFELADPGVDVSTGYVAADGTWVLFYESVSTSKAWVISRATAPGPQGPWAIADVPVLGAGPAGSFDAGGVAWPSVVRVGGRCTTRAWPRPAAARGRSASPSRTTA
jgi:hypothetical protein